jgi:hypothetical protein
MLALTDPQSKTDEASTPINCRSKRYICKPLKTNGKSVLHKVNIYVNFYIENAWTLSSRIGVVVSQSSGPESTTGRCQEWNSMMAFKCGVRHAFRHSSPVSEKQAIFRIANISADLMMSFMSSRLFLCGCPATFALTSASSSLMGFGIKKGGDHWPKPNAPSLSRMRMRKC